MSCSGFLLEMQFLEVCFRHYFSIFSSCRLHLSFHCIILPTGGFFFFSAATTRNRASKPFNLESEAPGEDKSFENIFYSQITKHYMADLSQKPVKMFFVHTGPLIQHF